MAGVNARAHNNFEFLHLLTRNTSREKVSAYLSAAHSLPPSLKELLVYKRGIPEATRIPLSK